MAPLLGYGQEAQASGKQSDSPGSLVPAALRLCPRAFPQNIPPQLKASWPYKAACGHLSQALTPACPMGASLTSQDREGPVGALVLEEYRAALWPGRHPYVPPVSHCAKSSLWLSPYRFEPQASQGATTIWEVVGMG